MRPAMAEGAAEASVVGGRSSNGAVDGRVSAHEDYKGNGGRGGVRRHLGGRRYLEGKHSDLFPSDAGGLGKGLGAGESVKKTSHGKLTGGRGGGERDLKSDRRLPISILKLRKEGVTYGRVLTKESQVDRGEVEDRKKKTCKLSEGKKIRWADQDGSALARCCPVDGDSTAEDGDDVKDIAGATSKGTRGKGVPPDVKEPSRRRTYKEVLLQPALQRKYTTVASKRGGTETVQERKGDWSGCCFICLARDHWARECRGSIRCRRCLKIGHLARVCRSAGRSRMQGAGRFRPRSMKVFVPLSEGYNIRQQQGRRAVLATPMGAADLGHFPQGLIANDMAGRFGGFANDFLVTKYRERDFVIFLPQWVQPEVMIRREGIRLAHCRLRCFSWNPHRDAVRARLTYKAWIKLVNLPFECWSESKVSSIVGGFGRYLRTDDSSRNLLEFNYFKCQVAVDDLADIPENLFITLGEVIVIVRVVYLSSAPFGGDDRGIPFAGGDPNEGGDQTDPMGRQLARWVDMAEGAAEASVVGAGGNSEGSSSWNSSEFRDRRRAESTTVASAAEAASRSGGGRRSGGGIEERGPNRRDVGVLSEPRSITAGVGCTRKKIEVQSAQGDLGRRKRTFLGYLSNVGSWGLCSRKKSTNDGNDASAGRKASGEVAVRDRTASGIRTRIEGALYLGAQDVVPERWKGGSEGSRDVEGSKLRRSGKVGEERSTRRAFLVMADVSRLLLGVSDGDGGKLAEEEWVGTGRAFVGARFLGGLGQDGGLVVCCLGVGGLWTLNCAGGVVRRVGWTGPARFLSTMCDGLMAARAGGGSKRGPSCDEARWEAGAWFEGPLSPEAYKEARVWIEGPDFREGGPYVPPPTGVDVGARARKVATIGGFGGGGGSAICKEARGWTEGTLSREGPLAREACKEARVWTEGPVFREGGPFVPPPTGVDVGARARKVATIGGLGGGGGSVTSAREGTGAFNPEPSPRKSRRLACRIQGGALERAVARKTVQREGAVAKRRGGIGKEVSVREDSRELGVSARDNETNAKIRRKGMEFGINLSDEDVCNFRRFLKVSP